MARNGVWGDNLEIQAFSELYGRTISIYAYDDVPMKTFSNESAANTDDDEQDGNGNDNGDGGGGGNEEAVPILLSYHCNSHYNSIVPLDADVHRRTLVDS